LMRMTAVKSLTKGHLDFPTNGGQAGKIVVGLPRTARGWRSL